MVVSQVIAAGAALSAFSRDPQHGRLMRLAFPRQDGPDAVLLPNTLTAHEEVSRRFRFEVELLSDDTHIPLKAMMARMVTISLVREDGSLRYFNGYVTEFRFLRTDGGFAFCHMVLEPWLAFAKLRKDNVSFHGKSVIELTELTFAVIRLDDKTDHGGHVISATSGSTVMGKAAALADDMIFCPACKGNFAIKPDGAGAKHKGRPYAYHGDVTECGAHLITSPV